MGSGLDSGLRNGASMQLSSPRVVRAAGIDYSRMNQTVTSGMMNGLTVTGGRKEGWANPDSTAKNGLDRRTGNLSI